jgi:Uma2 family endonuclease
MPTPAADRAKTLTLQEFENLPDDDGYRPELSRGLLVREPQPGARHGRTTGKMHLALSAYVSRENLGSVEIECGFLLSTDPPTVRGPDLSFISRERLPASLPVGFWPFAPDLAVEVLSPGNTKRELEQKVQDYFDGGTRLVWVVDPRTRTATVYRPRAEIRIVGEHESLSGDDVLPGLVLPLNSIFD